MFCTYGVISISNRKNQNRPSANSLVGFFTSTQLRSEKKETKLPFNYPFKNLINNLFEKNLKTNPTYPSLPSND